MNKEIYDSLTEEMQSIYTRYCLPDDLTGLTIDSVILSEDNKRQIDEFLKETTYKSKFIKYGLKPINRLLNYGASGTGKTFLTKCLAAHFGYELLSIDINNAIDSGNAAQAIEDIFKLGNHIGKAIIFLDECDVIARNRADKSVPTKPGTREAINGIFQLLDRMNPECIFVAATNLYTELDTAFTRRFNLKLQFDRPPIDNLDDTIKKFMLDSFSIEYDLESDIKEIILWHARNYTELSYNEIQTWVERAEKLAIMNDTVIIKESDIYNFFLDSLRLKLCRDDNGKLYLYQED